MTSVSRSPDRDRRELQTANETDTSNERRAGTNHWSADGAGPVHRSGAGNRNSGPPGSGGGNGRAGIDRGLGRPVPAVVAAGADLRRRPPARGRRGAGVVGL